MVAARPEFRSRQQKMSRPMVIASHSFSSRPPGRRRPRHHVHTMLDLGHACRSARHAALVARRRLQQQVASIAPVLQEPVEVPLAEPVALRLGVRASSPGGRGAPAERLGAHRLPAVGAHREGQVQVRVAIEAEAVVEATDLPQGLASDGQAVALDRVDLAGRRLVELAAVVARSRPTGQPARRAGSSKAASSGARKSPVGSSEVSSSTTISPRARRSPRLTASAQPSRSSDSTAGEARVRAAAAHRLLRPARWRPARSSWSMADGCARSPASRRVRSSG